MDTECDTYAKKLQMHHRVCGKHKNFLHIHEAFVLLVAAYEIGRTVVGRQTPFSRPKKTKQSMDAVFLSRWRSNFGNNFELLESKVYPLT